MLSAAVDLRPAGERKYGVDKHLVWLGSKHDARQLIAWHVPVEVAEVVSPFLGSGAVEFALLRQRPSLRVAGSDLDEGLVIFWKAMLSSSLQVARSLAKLIPCSRPITREEFDRERARMFNQPHVASPPLTAARFWLVNHLCWSGQMGCMAFAPQQAEAVRKTRGHLLNHVRGFRAPGPAGRLRVTRKGALEVIRSSPPAALLFIDPPYLDWDLGTTLSRKQYSCGSNWGIDKHRELRNLLRGCQRWILCHEDSPEIRNLYRGFHVVEYSKSAGGTMKAGAAAQPIRTELLICSRWVSERLPEGQPPTPLRGGADAAVADCPKCNGRRKSSPANPATDPFRHKCPLSGARSAMGCMEACAICHALLPSSRRDGAHQAHCKKVWPDLWKAHVGPAVVPVQLTCSASGDDASRRLPQRSKQRVRKRPAAAKCQPSKKARRL
mmetsp:Transcript_133334/g.414616  ORF Transcript_133334/g.414616 Transcript_133334/m.414616 type:complete len:439 (-) Transcript_133334:62-1378(-)